VNNVRNPILVASILAVAAAAAAPASAAQIAPNILFIGANERGAELVVHNPGGAPIEFEVSLLFGYEDAGEDGAVGAVYPDDPDPARSAVSWLRAYPQRAVVPPGQRQTIRLFRRPPPDLPEGEYWARVSIQSRPTEIPSRALGEEEVQVRVGVTTRQRIPVFVRIGAPEASVKIAEVQARYESAEESEEGGPTVVARYQARLEGNAAFLGHLSARIEKDGEVLAEAAVPMAIFVDGRRRARIPLPDGATREGLEGARLVLEATRRHPAIQSRHLLPGEGDRFEGPLDLD
jgi:P pilus assembly chaperone PapD